MFLDETLSKPKPRVTLKHKFAIKMPLTLFVQLKGMAKIHYSGRGKYSQLVNDALTHFINFSDYKKIDWQRPEEDDRFMELVTQIRLGANVKNLDPNPIQIFIHQDLMEQLIDLEASIKGARKLLNIHVKPAIVRRAIARWMFADVAFIKKNNAEQSVVPAGTKSLKAP